MRLHPPAAWSPSASSGPTPLPSRVSRSPKPRAARWFSPQPAVRRIRSGMPRWAATRRWCPGKPCRSWLLRQRQTGCADRWRNRDGPARPSRGHPCATRPTGRRRARSGPPRRSRGRGRTRSTHRWTSRSGHRPGRSTCLGLTTSWLRKSDARREAASAAIRPRRQSGQAARSRE